MSSDLAAADAVLKIGYGDIHEQIAGPKVKLLSLIESGAQHINMKNNAIEFAAHMRRSGGIGARGEGEVLPGAGQSKDARGTYGLVYQYGTIQGSGQVFAQVVGNSTAFVDWMQREMRDLIDTENQDLSRQCYGDGTGTLATLTASATTATSVTVDDVHWLEVGMTVDILTAATLANDPPTSGIVSGTIATISDINETTLVVTFTGATATAASGSVLVRGDYQESAIQNNWGKEWVGLSHFLGGGTVEGIDPTTFPLWQAGYTEGSVGTLAEADLTNMVTAISNKGGKVTDILASYGVVYAYWQLLQGLRRYSGNDTLAGGVNKMPVFQSIFGDVPFVADQQAPSGMAQAINRNELFLHRLADWAWFDRTGAIWQQVPGRDAWKATTFQYGNLGAFRLNTHGKLSGITEA